MSAFGDRIRALRGKEKQEVVAKEIGTTAQSLGRYENGKHKPDIEIALKLADYYNTTVDYLLGRTDIKSRDPEIQNVCEYTGLSEEAWYFVEGCKNDKSGEYSKILSLILANPHFQEIVLCYEKIRSIWESRIDYNSEQGIKQQKALNGFEEKHKEELEAMQSDLIPRNGIKRSKDRCKTIQFDIQELTALLQRELIATITGTNYFGKDVT